MFKISKHLTSLFKTLFGLWAMTAIGYLCAWGSLALYVSRLDIMQFLCSTPGGPIAVVTLSGVIFYCSRRFKLSRFSAFRECNIWSELSTSGTAAADAASILSIFCKTTAIAFSCVMLPLCCYYFCITAATACGSIGSYESGERIFKMVSWLPQFDKDDSVAGFQAAFDPHAEVRPMDLALTRAYGKSSLQSAGYNLKLGTSEFNAAMYESARNHLLKSLLIFSDSSTEIRFLRQSEIMNRLAYIDLASGHKHSAQLLFETGLAKMDSSTIKPPARLLHDYYSLASAVGEEKLHYTLMDKFAEQYRLEEKTGPLFDVVKCLIMAGFFIIISFWFMVSLETILLISLKNRWLKIKDFQDFNLGVAHKIIAVDLYLGRLEQANTDSVRLLRSLVYETKR